MPSWLKDAVFYEIYPQSFCDSNGDGIGDLQGIISKLDYVKSLGCNAIWLNPIYDSPFMDAGYDVRDYRLVAPRYGTNQDAKELFEAAHQKGIKILLDLVPGHTSDTHPWFLESKKPQENQYTARYPWTNEVWDAPLPYKWICGMAQRNGCYMVNFFSSQPALNYGFANIHHPWQLPPSHPACQATVEAIKDIMRFWLDMGCDGFRVDMADSLVKGEDNDKPETCKIWRGVRAMLDAEYPQAALVSEWCKPAAAVASAGFHCDFYLDHDNNGYRSLFRRVDGETGRCMAVFKKEGLGDVTHFLNEYLADLEAIRGKGYISLITCNHDTPRMTKLFDQTELPLATSFIFLMPGVPFLYYGDEIGMKYQGQLLSKEGGYQRTGSRTPMQWAAGPNLGFSAAEPDRLYLPVDGDPQAPTVEAQEQDAGSLLNTLRRVIALRHSDPDLQADGPLEVVWAQKNQYPFVLRRGKYVIAVNPTAQPQTAPVGCPGREVFALGGCTQAPDSLTLAPQSLVVLAD